MSQITEELDYKELYAAYSPIGRNPETEPRIMFKVLVYSYMEFTYSSRRIEKACRRDISFMRLLNGETVLDDGTINRFRKDRLEKAMEGLSVQLVMKLCEIGEVKFEDIFWTEQR